MTYSVFYHHVLEASVEQGVTIDEALEWIRSLGISAVELDRDVFTTDREALTAFSQRLKRHGLFASCIYGFFDWEKPDPEPEKSDLLLYQAELLDCSMIMAIPGFYTDRTNKELCSVEKARMLERMGVLTERASKRGIKVVIEDFDNGDSPIGTMAGMDDFLKEIPRLQVALDTGNFIFHGEDVLQARQHFGDRICHVHLKDRMLCAPAGPDSGKALPTIALDGQPLYPCAVGDGQIPIARIIDEMKAMGYDKVMAIEHFGVPSFTEAIRRSALWLSKRGALNDL